jgi:hypothetical protein
MIRAIDVLDLFINRIIVSGHFVFGEADFLFFASPGSTNDLDMFETITSVVVAPPCLCWRQWLLRAFH